MERAKTAWHPQGGSWLPLPPSPPSQPRPQTRGWPARGAGFLSQEQHSPAQSWERGRRRRDAGGAAGLVGASAAVPSNWHLESELRQKPRVLAAPGRGKLGRARLAAPSRGKLGRGPRAGLKAASVELSVSGPLSHRPADEGPADASRPPSTPHTQWLSVTSTSQGREFWETQPRFRALP